MTPAIAGLTILSKFQNDVRNSEAQMVDYFHKKIGEVKVVFDEFQAIAQANTTYACLVMTSKLRLVWVPSALQPNLTSTINGQTSVDPRWYCYI